MKITETKIVSASTREVVVTVCDSCGGKGAGRLVDCLNCSRDVCRTCGTYAPDNPGDYPGMYCPSCWELRGKYAAMIDRIEQYCDARMERYQRQWKRESLGQAEAGP